MRQKDVDMLAAIWRKELDDHVRPEEELGFEAAIGAIIGPLRYNSDPAHPLDLRELESLAHRAGGVS